MDFYNEFLEQLRNGKDASAIASEITKALNDSIKAKADEDEAAKKAKQVKLDEEIERRLESVKNAEKDMNDYLDVMIDYVNDYLDAYAEAHEKNNAETMTKDELRSLLDGWAMMHIWIDKIANMNLNSVLNETSDLWKVDDDVNIKSQPSANITATTNLDQDSLDKIFGDVKKPCKKAEVSCDCDCDKSVKKPIKATEAIKGIKAIKNIKADMSADDIINEFLKAIDRF